MARTRGGGPTPKQEQILRAATSLFLARGYAGTSMEAVRERAGVSKPTLYAYYDSKAELFRGVEERYVRQHLDGWVDEVDAEPPTTLAELRAALVALAERFLTATLGEPDRLTLLRIVIAEGPAFPELGRHFRAATFERALTAVGALLARAADLGLVRVEHPEVAVRLLLGPLLSYVVSEGLLGPGPAPVPPSRDAVEALVDLHLRALAPAPPDATRG